MENEIWKDVKGYEGLYMVSNLGNVKSLGNNKKKKEKMLKPCKVNCGYLQITLYKNGEIKRIYVHKLVAEAFIPNPENKPEVDHINTIRDDNKVENLCWVTKKENMNNPLTKENMRESLKKMSESHMGENHHMYGKHHSEETRKKMSESHKGKINNKPRRIYCIELDKIYNSIREAEKELNISRTNIIKACKDINKSAGKHPITKEKLHWRYL